jgi:hypothetical protein
MSEEHHGPDCPECRAHAQAAQVLGGFGEAMQKMLDTGAFERMGQEFAYRREQAFLNAFLGNNHGPAPTS